MKKILSMLLVLTMAIGCMCTSAFAEDASARIVPEGETLELTIWQTFEASKGITMTSFNDMKTWPLIEEETGIKVNFKHPAVGSENEQFNLMLASGDMPDIVFYAWHNVAGGPMKAISDGLILDLNDIVAENCPNYSSMLEANPEIKQQIVTDEGALYGFASISMDDRDKTAADYIPAFQTFGWCVRQDWLETLGIEKLPETMDEWEAALTAMKNGDPNGNGQADEIPLVASSAGEITNWIRAWGINNDFYIADPENQTVAYGYYTEEYRDALTTLARWYQNGLIDPDFAASDSKQKDSKITSNVAGAWTGSTSGGFGRYITMMKPVDPSVKLTGTTPPTVTEGETYKFDSWSKYPIGREAAISANSEHPVEAARFCDYFYGESGHMYMNWGIEGESYTIDENGAPAFTELVTNNPDGLSVDQVLIQYALAADDFFFCMDPELWLARMSLPEQREMLPRWATGSRDRIMPPVLPTSDEAAEFASIMGEVKTYVDEMFTKFVMGVESMDNFDNYMSTLQSLGIDRAIELKQIQLDRYNAR